MTGVETDGTRWLGRAGCARGWRRTPAITLLAGVLGLAAAAPPAAESQSGIQRQRITQAAAPTSVKAGTEQKAFETYGKLPLAFVPNAGQTDPRVRYSAQAGGASFYFTPSEAVFAFANGKQGLALRLDFLGANPSPDSRGAAGSGQVNYLLETPGEVAHQLPTYRGRLRDLWPGIDGLPRDKASSSTSFRLAPGADPREIRLPTWKRAAVARRQGICASTHARNDH